MTEIPCTYGDDRDAAIVAFLYDDADGSPAARARFETHLQNCAQCHADVAALRGVRAQLARWSPPEPTFTMTNPQSNPQSAIRNPQWWQEIPAWAQVAAALLFLGVSAGIANLDVRYDHNGLSVRTGWSPRAGGSDGARSVARAGAAGKSDVSETLELTPGTNNVAPPAGMAPASGIAQGAGDVVQSLVVSDQTAPWRADLAALERRLKTEVRATQASSTAQTVRAVSTTDADVSRVRVLLQESEKRQQRELALRIAELLRDVDAQRHADLVKIDRTLGQAGVEVMKNRQQLDQMNLLYRASQRQ